MGVVRDAFALAVVVAAVVVSPLAIPAAQSQTAIKLIIPYPPGGGADVLARILANQIANMGGPTMVVENRPGAGTVIGTKDVVRAAPDGNTLLLTNNALLLAPHLHKLDYDPLSSLEPICSVGTTPTVVVVNSGSPYRTLDDLIGAARTRPGALTFGANIGALSHVSYEMLMHRADFKMTLVPYSGTLPEVEAVFAGQIDTAFVDYPPAQGLLQAGKIKALASASRARVDWLPDIPTVSELGYKNFEVELWYGVLAPAHTPHDITAKFADWFTKAAQQPQIRSQLLKDGIDTAAIFGAPFAAALRKRFDEYGQVIREANIKAE